MGLLVSAAVTSEDQATALIPLAMIGQLLFGGAVVTIHEMGGVMRAISNVAFSRWAFDGVGSIVHMRARLAGDPLGARYGGFFGLGAGRAYLALAIFLVVFFGGTLLTLRGRRR
jgi:ABC-type multidrug transport system permease subunit